MAEGQIIFLVCKPCEEAHEDDFGFKLCGRTQGMWFEPLGPSAQFAKWLQKHRKCGEHGKPDHFNLGYSYPLNHDQQQMKPVAKAVKLAVVR